MVDKLRNYLSYYVETMHLYDYLALVALVILFLVFIVLAIKNHARIGRSVTYVLLSFATIIAGPVASNYFIAEYLYASQVYIEKIKDLEFSNALVIRGTVENIGHEPFTSCDIHAKVIRKGNNIVKEYAYKLKPMYRKKITIETTIAPTKHEKFKLYIEPFNTTREYNTTVESECR
jgi:hypothetical protein